MTKRNALPALVMLFPALVFYALLSRETVNLPFLDDYTGVLGFLNAWKGIATVRGKLLDILLTQHNEYKLIFAQAVFAIQYLASGKVDFAVLSALGNGLVVPIFLVLGAMWRADGREIENRLLLFVPVAWVLFQFQYYSLLNWPVASLQQLAALLFSLLAIHLLCGEGRASFWWAIASMGLAIGASGNGLFLAPIGGLMLLQFRRTRRLLGWAAAAAAMVAGYFYGYDTRQSQAHADHSVVSSLHHLSPLYALSFLGASIARYDDYLPSALLGGAVVLTFLWAARVRLYARSPALFYSMLFALATAAAVSGLRSDLGVSQSLVSRYRIYSKLVGDSVVPLRGRRVASAELAPKGSNDGGRGGDGGSGGVQPGQHLRRIQAASRPNRSDVGGGASMGAGGAVDYGRRRASARGSSHQKATVEWQLRACGRGPSPIDRTGHL